MTGIRVTTIFRTRLCSGLKGPCKHLQISALALLLLKMPGAVVFMHSCVETRARKTLAGCNEGSHCSSFLKTIERGGQRFGSAGMDPLFNFLTPKFHVKQRVERPAYHN